MTAPAPSEPGKRSKRMIVWLVVVPAVLLLLTAAGLNWRFFHLAWCRSLIRSEDLAQQRRGFALLKRTHLRDGMTVDEAARLLRPAEVFWWMKDHNTLYYRVAIPDDGVGVTIGTLTCGAHDNLLNPSYTPYFRAEEQDDDHWQKLKAGTAEEDTDTQ